MLKRMLGLSAVSLLMSALVACNTSAQADNTQSASTHSTATPSTPTELAQTPDARDLSQLFSRVWQVADAPSEAAPNSIYIFLSNGTLLQASCVETYRISAWTIDQESPQVLEIIEDDSLAFTASIEELSDTTLTLQKELVRSGESQTVTLTAVQDEFFCPSLPR